MIVKSSQRAGGAQLAAHLLNKRDNERVAVADIRGLLAEDVHGAFAEIEAQARATRCRKPFYHLAVSPDQVQGKWTEEQYLEFVGRVETAFGLENCPRVLVYHSKRGKQHYRDQGRDHAHCTWGRIDTETGKAVQIWNDHKRLMKLVREFARDHGLELPDGIADPKKDRQKAKQKAKTLAEQKQEERSGQTKSQRVAILTDAWERHEEAGAFVAAIRRKGFILARGDGQKRKEGRDSKPVYVVIDRAGEVHSLARQITGAKAKEITARLQDGYALDALDDVAAARGRLKAGKQRQRTAGKEQAEPDFVDRDRQNQDWEAAVIQAAIEKEQAQQAAKTAEKKQHLRPQFNQPPGHPAPIFNQGQPEPAAAPSAAEPLQPVRGSMFGLLSFLTGWFRPKRTVLPKFAKDEAQRRAKNQAEIWAQREQEQKAREERDRQRTARPAEQEPAQARDFAERKILEGSTLQQTFAAQNDNDQAKPETPAAPPRNEYQRLAALKAAQKERQQRDKGLDFDR